MSKFIVSPSPHIHSGNSVQKSMYGVIVALLPALAVSLVFFGLGALIITLTAILSCVIFEYVIQKYLLKGEPTILDGSAILTGLLLAFNVPSNLPIWMMVVGAAVAIGIAKMTFGGLGNNPFNPALAGRVFMLISFPVHMTSWPKPEILPLTYIDAVTGATPLGIMKEGLAKGDSLTNIMTQIPSFTDMLIGKMGGSLGEISAIALLIGFVYLLWKKIITWHIPVSVIGAVAIFTAILHGANPQAYAGPVFHIFTGGLLLGAIFMATDYVTSPMSKTGMLIYGTMIGVITILIRVFGAYPEGVSFAILIMNAFTPLINKYIKPKRYGEILK
ncbi:MAG: RnfABCDGE type electron transport complex subunit D [Paludibacteraceae bacterium]|nr:RnfABCDGE type electron transport complex subunit D [Paludibacteraceae bacterium]MBN2787316.1 RnfABCDGE type electron transport complex subunit D [Paludibacteraceae bacterium]